MVTPRGAQGERRSNCSRHRWRGKTKEGCFPKRPLFFGGLKTAAPYNSCQALAKLSNGMGCLSYNFPAFRRYQY
jgi:hypothetical protein